MHEMLSKTTTGHMMEQVDEASVMVEKSIVGTVVCGKSDLVNH